MTDTWAEKRIKELEQQVKYLVLNRAQTLWLVELLDMPSSRWDRICSPRPKAECEELVTKLTGGVFRDVYRVVEWEVAA